MITIQTEINLPVINFELDGVMKEIGQLLSESVAENFREGGRPLPWAPLKHGIGIPLADAAQLLGSVRVTSGPNFVEVESGSGLPYAGIHQFGGETHPNVTNRTRSFFWAMWHSTGDEMWKWRALTKKHQFTIHIPPRPYLVIQDEDIEWAKSLLVDAIVE